MSVNKKRGKKLLKIYMNMRVVDEYICDTLKAFEAGTQLGMLQSSIISDIPNLIIEDLLGCKNPVEYFGEYRTEKGFLSDQAWECVYYAESYPDVLQELYRLEGIRESLNAQEPRKAGKGKKSKKKVDTK